MMTSNKTGLLPFAIALAALFLSGCGGGGGDDSPSGEDDKKSGSTGVITFTGNHTAMIGAISAYLSNLDYVPTMDNPAPLKIIGLNVANQNQITDLLYSITRLVALDLTESSGAEYVRPKCGSKEVFNCDELGMVNVVSVKLPNSVNTISGSAFSAVNIWGFKNLVSVTAPNANAIGVEAFYYATALTDITLGANPPTLGFSCFYGANALATVHVPAIYSVDYNTTDPWKDLTKVTP